MSGWAFYKNRFRFSSFMQEKKIKEAEKIQELFKMMEYEDKDIPTVKEILSLPKVDEMAMNNCQDHEEETIFPWDDVDACLNSIIPPMSNGKPCPKCGTPPEKLKWINFRSPDWTWKHLCGCGGPMSICEKCHKQVEFYSMIMN